MSISLVKGQKIDITKGTGLNNVTFAMGWDKNIYDTNENFDLDIAVFLTGSNGKVTSEADFVFFNQPTHPSGAIKFSGDNTTGSGSGDDETMVVDIAKIPSNIEKLSFVATIYDAEVRMQNFGMVNNAYIRAFDTNTKEEIFRFDLDEDYSMETGIVAGELYKRNNEWKFNPVGNGFEHGLATICANFGIIV